MRQEHLDYFNKTLNKVKHSINVWIPITPYDHEKIKGRKNALGICTGSFVRFADGSDAWEPEKITIDEYFIEECYEAEVNGKRYMLDLVGDNLVGVLCHEIAHIVEPRHGKKHTALTRHLISLVEQGKPHGIEV